jgi:hypothetical protein
MDCDNGELSLCCEGDISYLPPVTPLPSASHRRSPHAEASAHDRLGPFASAPCLTLTGTDGAWSCSQRAAHPSTFLSPFPQSGFASRSFSASLCNGTMETLTATQPTHRAALPAFLANTFPSFRLQPRGLPGHRYHHASVPSEFQTSPWNRRLVAAPRRIEFVHLRTDPSP